MTTTKQIDHIDHPNSPAPEQPPRHRHPRHRHHRWRIAATVVVGLVVVGAAIPTVRYLLRSHPGARSVSSAVQRYRASTSTTPGDAPRVFQGPRPGVYQATGSGTEKISFPPNSQRDGAVMPITVTALSKGCWRWHLDYNTAHWHEYDFCPQKGSLMLVAQRNFQAWDFGSIKITNLGQYTCSPPAPIVVEAARPGQSFEHHCTGTNSAVAGPSTVQGPATLVGTVEQTIGGQKVLALHQTRVEHLSGAQKGTTTEEWWFDARTGLPLRAERHYDLTSPSPIGTVTYNESGSWQLSSLQPTS